MIALAAFALHIALVGAIVWVEVDRSRVAHATWIGETVRAIEPHALAFDLARETPAAFEEALFEELQALPPARRVFDELATELVSAASCLGPLDAAQSVIDARVRGLCRFMLAEPLSADPSLEVLATPPGVLVRVPVVDTARFEAVRRAIHQNVDSGLEMNLVAIGTVATPSSAPRPWWCEFEVPEFIDRVVEATSALDYVEFPGGAQVLRVMGTGERERTLEAADHATSWWLGALGRMAAIERNSEAPLGSPPLLDPAQLVPRWDAVKDRRFAALRAESDAGSRADGSSRIVLGSHVGAVAFVAGLAGLLLLGARVVRFYPDRLPLGFKAPWCPVGSLGVLVVLIHVALFRNGDSRITAAWIASWLCALAAWSLLLWSKRRFLASCATRR